MAAVESPSAGYAEADHDGGTGGAFTSGFGDFYLSNPIARASKVMAECSRLAQADHLEAAE